MRRPCTKSWKMLSIMSLMIAALTSSSQPSAAHPHVWVTYATTITYKDGLVTGLDHVWTFDDMYTAMAVQGLDKNGDGQYDRAELAELAKINIEGLTDFDYFTFAKLGPTDLKFSAPQDAWLEHSNGILKLHFRLPLAKPVFADAPGLNFQIFDPTYFIAFDPEKTDPIKLAAAPAGCQATLQAASDEATQAEVDKLGEALAQELGGDFSGLGVAKTVSVSCKQS